MDFGFASASPPFFNNENMNYSNMYNEDSLADIQDSWNRNIDPQLQRMSQPAGYQSWQSQQQPMQRFINAPERSLYTATHFQTYPQLSQGVNRPTSAFPHANNNRMVSPAPSQDITSICSSARSPGAEVDDRYPDQSYYSPQSQNDFLPAPTTNLPNQGFSDFWAGQQQSFPTNNHVNMSQVQSFADPQDPFFETDEGFIDQSQDFKAEYGQDGNSHLYSNVLKDSGSQQAYHYTSDEGLGASIKDAASPANSTSDLDADGEADDDDSLIKAEPEPEVEAYEAEEDEDEEYTPHTTRTRKRRASNYTSLPTKRTRATKSLCKTKKSIPFKTTNNTNNNTTACPTCSRSDFKDAAALQKHINSSHLRPYTCVFSFAGCPSTFASKNEWKRHVTTQHLNLHAWICTQGACAKAPRLGPGGGRGSEFNRKDLFTQHARRMHAPGGSNGVKGAKGGKEWEEQLKKWQEECLMIKRHSPQRLNCPVESCGDFFQGANAWDERMEHVGKHLESVASAKGKGEVVRQGDDAYLVGWAVREGIVVKVAGGFRFPREGEVVVGVGGDVDAEGEEE